MNASIPVLLLLAVLASAAPQQRDETTYNPPVNTDYPHDYVWLYDLAEYRISHDAVTWEEASQACEADGAELVVIRSGFEFDAILTLVTIPNYFWYGALPNGTENGTKKFVTVFGDSLEESGFDKWALDPDSDDFNDPIYNRVLFNRALAGPSGSGLLLSKDDNQVYLCKRES